MLTVREGGLVRYLPAYYVSKMTDLTTLLFPPDDGTD